MTSKQNICVIIYLVVLIAILFHSLWQLWRDRSVMRKRDTLWERERPVVMWMAWLSIFYLIQDGLNRLIHNEWISSVAGLVVVFCLVIVIRIIRKK